jgi:hypothetical protein
MKYSFTSSFENVPFNRTVMSYYKLLFTILSSITSGICGRRAPRSYLHRWNLLKPKEYTECQASVQSSELGPLHHPQGSVAPPESKEEGEGERGDPIPTKGQTLWYCMYTIIPLRSNPSFTTAFHRQALPATQRKKRINGRLRKVDSCYIGWGLGFEGNKDDIKKGWSSTTIFHLWMNQYVVCECVQLQKHGKFSAK